MKIPPLPWIKRPSSFERTEPLSERASFLAGSAGKSNPLVRERTRIARTRAANDSFRYGSRPDLRAGGQHEDWHTAKSITFAAK